MFFFLVTKDRTEDDNQTETEGSCPEGLVKHLKGGNSAFGDIHDGWCIYTSVNCTITKPKYPSCADDIIWRQSLRSCDQADKPLRSVPSHTPTCPIMSNTEPSIIFHDALEEELVKNKSVNKPEELNIYRSDENYLKTFSMTNMKTV